MKKIALFLSSILLFTAALFAQNNEKKFKGWKKAETEHFTFIYEDAQKEATQGYIKIADDAWNQVGKIYAFPQDKTNVYVTGRTNTVNAFTYFSPAEIGMFTNPCTLTDFTFRDNWQKLFFTHELIHIANINFEDKSKLPELMFGSFMTSVDMSFVNGWALEGLATVLETELTNGGRGRSPYFELNYKSLTLDNGFIPYENIGLEKEPPRGQSYVMGYLIMRSIADRYGIQALADIERNRPFLGSFEKSVQLVTGQTPQDIYRDVRIALAKKYADVVISMDADLQDDINAVDEMLDKYYEGKDIVYGVRSSRKKDTWFKKTTAQGFYKFMKMMGVDVVYNHADYRLTSKRVLDEFSNFKEVNLFLRGMFPLIGFESDVVYYERNERFAGESKYPLKKMLNFAWDGITSFSVKPIRLILSLGFIMLILSLLVLLYCIIVKILGHAVAGWTFIVCSIWLVAAIEMFAIGLIGEYIGKIYSETKERPRYIISENLNEQDKK